MSSYFDHEQTILNFFTFITSSFKNLKSAYWSLKFQFFLNGHSMKVYSLLVIFIFPL